MWTAHPCVEFHLHSMPKALVCFPGAPYTEQAARAAADAVLEGWEVHTPKEAPADADATPPGYDAYIVDYDLLPFDDLALQNALCSSYYIRKALIRKHHLAQALHMFGVKRGVPVDVIPRTWTLDVQFADELDELLADDLYDVRDALVANESSKDTTWFILKPGMADQGNGIQLFSSLERLQQIFEDMEDESDDEDNEESTYASHLRHFVIQQYLVPPMLVAPSEGGMRKFHLRAYVICVGGLAVYLHDDMLALFASVPYSTPSEDGDLQGHLSNTCLGEREAKARGVPVLPNVFRLRDLLGKEISTPGSSTGTMSQAHLDAIHRGAVAAIGTVFEAVAREASVHWQMWPNAFEIFGVDLMVTADPSLSPESLHVWLLEINAVCPHLTQQPDFKQSGEALRKTIEHVFQRALQLGVLRSESPWTKGESRDGVTCCFAEEMVKDA